MHTRTRLCVTLLGGTFALNGLSGCAFLEKHGIDWDSIVNSPFADLFIAALGASDKDAALVLLASRAGVNMLQDYATRRTTETEEERTEVENAVRIDRQPTQPDLAKRNAQRRRLVEEYNKVPDTDDENGTTAPNDQTTENGSPTTTYEGIVVPNNDNPNKVTVALIDPETNELLREKGENGEPGQIILYDIDQDELQKAGTIADNTTESEVLDRPEASETRNSANTFKHVQIDNGMSVVLAPGTTTTSP